MVTILGTLETFSSVGSFFQLGDQITEALSTEGSALAIGESKPYSRDLSASALIVPLDLDWIDAVVVVTSCQQDGWFGVHNLIECVGVLEYS